MAPVWPTGASNARKVREVEILAAEGVELNRALQLAGVSEADYLALRAEVAGVDVGRLAWSHRAWRTAERTIDPRDYTGRTLQGVCLACGGRLGFENFTENLRESGACRGCGSSSRQRQMAIVLRQRLGLGAKGPLRLPNRTRIHNCESTGALHNRLRRAPGYTFSEYWGPEHAAGEVVNGIRHEDLQALSFADECLDVVLSSDVLEHMPDPYVAHAEIFRVLRPGGVHVFTVPFHGAYRDDVRARIQDGEIRYHGEQLYHGDPIRPEKGVLVWTIFGSEMLDRLDGLGFKALMWKFSDPRLGVPDVAVVFEARKPGPPPSSLVRFKQKLGRMLPRPAPRAA